MSDDVTCAVCKKAFDDYEQGYDHVIAEHPKEAYAETMAALGWDEETR